jgi:membrane associated rhomboid family serine protease
MIEDRDYMRLPSSYDGHWPRLSFTMLLIILNAALFVLQLISYQVFPPRSANLVSPTDALFALSLDGLNHYHVWQFLTYQFMHAGWMHLLFNCVAIFFFGRAVEMVLGRGRFLALYLTSGIIGGVVQMLFALVLPQYFNAPVVGASAGASGLVAAFAVLNWQERFTMFIYFFPVVMRGRTLFWVSIALAVIGILTPNSGIANAAHLGGILTGFVLVRRLVRDRSLQWEPPFRRNPPRALASHLKENKFWRARAIPPAEDLTAEEFLQKEVDPILDKISAQGIQSLTARERETLEKARAKMAKR